MVVSPGVLPLSGRGDSRDRTLCGNKELSGVSEIVVITQTAVYLYLYYERAGALDHSLADTTLEFAGCEGECSLSV